MKLFILACLLVQTINAVDWIKGRGAQVAFVEVEAEHAHHNGKDIGHNRTYCLLSSEASQRRAVQLDAVGQFVEFTMPIEANSIVVRQSIPDSADGKGLDAALDLYVNGAKLKELKVTSRYSWYYGGYPFNNNPGSGHPHHFFDESRTMFDKAYPKGTKVKLQVSSTDHAKTFTIDVADFELVLPPKAKPAGALSVVDFKADPTSKTDSTTAFQAAVNAGSAQKKPVYIPQGNYLIYDHVTVDNVELIGAGPWYSVLGGRHPTDRKKAVGIYGKWAPDMSHNVHLKDFAIIGEITERLDDDQVNGLGGAMSNTLVDNLWIQHVKVGAWMDGPMDNFSIINSRIVDTTADGVNFHKGVTNSKVFNTFLRNTGDDGLAMWAQDVANVNNKFNQNTMGIPVLANNIAIYGGKDIEVNDNLVYDTLTNGGGIHVGNRYPGVNGKTAVAGKHSYFRNTMLRAGNNDYGWNFGIGAIWFSGQNEPINQAELLFKDCDIIDASYEAIQYVSGNVKGVTLEDCRINGTGTWAMMFQAGDEITIKNLKAINIGHTPPLYGGNIKINVEGSKDNWFTDKREAGPYDAAKPKWDWIW